MLLMQIMNFSQCLLNILNKHAPIKTKVIRDNQAPYVTKAYS